jgi:hypothetical protein
MKVQRLRCSSLTSHARRLTGAIENHHRVSRPRTLSQVAAFTLLFSTFLPSAVEAQDSKQARVEFMERNGKREVVGLYNLTEGLEGTISCSPEKFTGRIIGVKHDSQLPLRVVGITMLTTTGRRVYFNVEQDLYDDFRLSRADMGWVGEFLVEGRGLRVTVIACGASGSVMSLHNAVLADATANSTKSASPLRSTPPPSASSNRPQHESVSRTGTAQIRYGYGGQFGRYDIADTAEAYNGQQLLARAQAIELQDSPGGGPRTLKIRVTHFSASGSITYAGYVYIQAGFGGGRLVREEDVTGGKTEIHDLRHLAVWTLAGPDPLAWWLKV